MKYPGARGFKIDMDESSEVGDFDPQAVKLDLSRISSLDKVLLVCVVCVLYLLFVCYFLT